jgi:Helix-turn-helix domain
LLTTEDLAGILRRTANTIVVDRCKGKGPRFIKVGRHVRYRASDVAAYIEELTAYNSTSALP